MRPYALLSLVFVATISGIGCSAAPVEEDGVSSESESELRTLDASEIVGTIDYGTSAMEVQNPGDSGGRKVYRAVKFQGTAGDEIEASAIGGNAADPVLYLLGSRFGTVAYNDDGRAGDKQPFIAAKLSKSGTYYLAFRTKEGWSTKFYVSLRKKGAPSPTPSPSPTPTPSPTPAPTWKDALGSFRLWGAEFKDVLAPYTYGWARKAVVCKVVPASSLISCGTMFDGTQQTATIHDDGSFSFASGTASTSGGELAGNVAVDGKVTLTRFRTTTCFQTSSSWCESQATDGQNLPSEATPYHLCRTPDQHFQQGGWAAGFYVDCAKCNDYGGCENQGGG